MWAWVIQALHPSIFIYELYNFGWCLPSHIALLPIKLGVKTHAFQCCAVTKFTEGQCGLQALKCCLFLWEWVLGVIYLVMIRGSLPAMLWEPYGASDLTPLQFLSSELLFLNNLLCCPLLKVWQMIFYFVLYPRDYQATPAIFSFMVSRVFFHAEMDFLLCQGNLLVSNCYLKCWILKCPQLSGSTKWASDLTHALERLPWPNLQNLLVIINFLFWCFLPNIRAFKSLLVNGLQRFLSNILINRTPIQTFSWLFGK